MAYYVNRAYVNNLRHYGIGGMRRVRDCRSRRRSPCLYRFTAAQASLSLSWWLRFSWLGKYDCCGDFGLGIIYMTPYNAHRLAGERSHRLKISHAGLCPRTIIVAAQGRPKPGHFKINFKHPHDLSPFLFAVKPAPIPRRGTSRKAETSKWWTCSWS